jgi:hypothetical protein
MEPLLNEIERGLNAGLYYLALMLALALPDICAALDSPDGVTSGQKYRDWYDANMAPKYPKVTAADCWSLRCGVLHQGRFGHPNMQYSRVAFTLPVINRIRSHNNIVNDWLNLDAVMFCRDMATSVRVWFQANQNNVNVMANLPKLVRLYPSVPALGGLPAIA